MASEAVNPWDKKCPQCDEPAQTFELFCCSGYCGARFVMPRFKPIEAAPEITEAMVDLRLRYDAYAEAVVEDAVGDTTGTLERRDEALNCLVESIGAALRAALVDKGGG